MAKRNWVFTLNNPGDDAPLKQRCTDDDVVRYAIWQRERGENGTEHLQGYLELARPCRMAQVKRILGESRVHLEERRGSREQARDYCRKDDTSMGDEYRFEYGEYEQRRGRRNDIEAFRDSVVSGSGDMQLLEEHPGAFLRYGPMVQRCRLAATKRRRRDMRLIICCGATGSGKSHFAWNYCDGDFDKVYKLFSKKPLWFDGYRGEDVLFIDEWEGEPGEELLKEITDVWPYMAPVKGGSVLANWTTVIIATNLVRADLEIKWLPPMHRRISQWREYRGRDSVTVTEVV